MDAKITPTAVQTIDRDSVGVVPSLREQPKIPDNGCCLLCCGKGPGPVDTNAILKDGGKFLQHEDGRIVEYFIYGSANNDDPNAPVFLQINGSIGTGYFSANLPYLNETLKRFNYRALSITLPGYGYTSMFQEGFRLGDWAKMDVEAVLLKENMQTAPLLVEGSSYGAALALGVLNYFGTDRVTHAHLHVPYIPYELRKELGMPEKIGDDRCFDKDMEWVNSCSSWWFHCKYQCYVRKRGCVLTCCPIEILDDEDIVQMEYAAPESKVTMHRDIYRAYRNGKNTYGVIHNIVGGGLISKNWGFDLKELKVPKTKVMISYNIGDTQEAPEEAETLPEYLQGKWLADHFTANAAVCKVNIGGGEDYPNFKAHIQPDLVDGEFVAQLSDL